MINIGHRSLRLLHNDIKQQTVNDSVNQNDKYYTHLRYIYLTFLNKFQGFFLCVLYNMFWSIFILKRYVEPQVFKIFLLPDFLFPR